VDQQLLRLVNKCANQWFYSVIRWRRERHDHCMQVTWMKLRVMATRPKPKRGKISETYRPREAQQSLHAEAVQFLQNIVF
jgi:hypothetical protein